MEVVDDWLGDMGIAGRPANGEGGVARPASSVKRARRSPVDRFIVSGLDSGDESLLVPLLL